MLIKEKTVYIFVLITPNMYLVWAKGFGKHPLNTECFISFYFSFCSLFSRSLEVVL